MEDSLRVKRYHRSRRALGVAGFLLDFAILLILLFTRWTIGLRTWSERWNNPPAFALLIYLSIFGLITRLVRYPLDFMKGFWLEHRFGLSNLSLSGWVKDQMKGLTLGGGLMVLGAEFLYWSTRRWPQYGG
jgi:hypothetical protein